MKKHRQTTLRVHEKNIAVDWGVRDLIRQLNAIPGIEAYYSCQGNHGANNAYVLFGGANSLVLLIPLAQAIFQEQSQWRDQHRHVCRGCPSMTVSLEVSGLGISLRWDFRDYHRVLRMVTALRKAMRPTKTFW
jgi:hypothetical protein